VKRISKERPTPTFQADIGPTELVELVSDSISQAGYQRVETSALKPQRFAGADGLHFELDATTESGLDVKGLAATAVSNGKLFVMIYLAPAEHYYRAGLPEVEAILASAA